MNPPTGGGGVRGFTRKEFTRKRSVPFFMAEYYSIIWIDHISFIHSSTNGHLGCFHFLAIVNRAAVNSCIQVFMWMYVFHSLG